MSVSKLGLSVLLILLGAPLLLVSSCRDQAGTGSEKQVIEDLTLEEAFVLMEDSRYDDNFIIIDVRTPEEYAGGHVEKAINLDYYSETFADELDKLDKDNIYLIYCQTNRRSGLALDIMAELGFREVYNMLGGMEEWEAVKLPTVK